jgi:hypothetical protein
MLQGLWASTLKMVFGTKSAQFGRKEIVIKGYIPVKCFFLIAKLWQIFLQ